MEGQSPKEMGEERGNGEGEGREPQGELSQGRESHKDEPRRASWGVSSRTGQFARQRTRDVLGGWGQCGADW